MSQTKRELLRTAAFELMTTATGIATRTRSLSEQPNQTARAFQADAQSCANACNSVLATVFPLLGYSVPMPDLFGLDDTLPEPQDKGEAVSEAAVEAAVCVIDLAQQACEVAIDREEALARYLQQQDDNSEVVQVPPPDVDGADFKQSLATNDQAYGDARLLYGSLQVRLADLATRHGDKTTLAAALLSGANALIVGLGQDLQIAKGEEWLNDGELARQKDKAVEQLEGTGEIGELFGELLDGLLDLGGEFVKELMAAEYDPTSAGTRVGFLRSATTEARLANVALQVAVASLNEVESIHVDPCLIGSPPGSLDGSASITEVPTPEVAPATESASATEEPTA